MEELHSREQERKARKQNRNRKTKWYGTEGKFETEHNCSYYFFFLVYVCSGIGIESKNDERKKRTQAKAIRRGPHFQRNLVEKTFEINRTCSSDQSIGNQKLTAPKRLGN